MRRIFVPTLCLVIDPDHCAPCSFTQVAFQAVQGGVTLLQFRTKTASTRHFVDQAREIRAIADQFKVPLLVNDRVDVALAVGAAGVHLGQSDLSPEDARRMLGGDAIIGLSASTLNQAKAAENLPIDYLGVGPVFSTRTKDDCSAPCGEKVLKEICESIELPVIAIGGIDSSNAGRIRSLGATGIAVVSAISKQPEPIAATRQLKEAFTS